MPAEKAFICVAGELAEPVADVQAQTPVVRLDISANADIAGKWVGIIDGYWSVAARFPLRSFEGLRERGDECTQSRRIPLGRAASK
ncbi:hypothetical protein [Streptomyces sp. NBC_00078]|uniref:hypothetical protein n=1 Tax=unclassified Streptomyces TaxID=2593676 RepID=UPI0022511E02|nr:hypothetical protein [Streptomyces sp. NBC_00078]MCX5424546.1 hypothetical protein [Streptomyces sp. NBC_00078]